MLTSLDNLACSSLEEDLVDQETDEHDYDNDVSVSDGDREGKVKGLEEETPPREDGGLEFGRQASDVDDDKSRTRTGGMNSEETSLMFSLGLVKLMTYILLLVGFTAYLVMYKNRDVILTPAEASVDRHDTNSTRENQLGSCWCLVNALVTAIVIFLSLPHGISFVADVYQGRPKRQDGRSLSSWLVILFFETIQTMSTCVVVVLILPEMTMIRALCLMELVAFLPGIYKLLLRRVDRKDMQRLKPPPVRLCLLSATNSLAVRSLFCFINGLALLGQITGLVISGSGNFDVLTLYPENATTLASSGDQPPNVPGPISGDPVATAGSGPMARYVWLLPVCLLLKCMSWWENLIDSELEGGAKSTRVSFQKWKLQMRDISRKTTTMFSGAWNINIVLSFPSVARGLSLRQLQNSAAASRILGDFNRCVPRLVDGLSGLFSFFFGTLVCELCVQDVCFSLPLLLFTPLTVCLLIVQCQQGFYVPDFGGEVLPELAWQMTCYVVFWIALLTVIGYLWRRKIDRTDDTIKHLYDPVSHSDRQYNNILRHNNVSGQNTDASADYMPPSDRYHGNDALPMIYACATMWHESKNEMMQLLNSVLRMDKDQNRKFNSSLVGRSFTNSGCYEYETHIFFDDAFELRKNRRIPNRYVNQLYDVIDEAVSLVSSVGLKAPQTVLTPYGGRLTWLLPGGTKLIAHLKDKEKIRHKKRWSQCMYMYYLLGYRLAGLRDDTMFADAPGDSGSKSQFLLNDLFGSLPDNVHNKAKNTFILALDGDVDFKPEAVRLLLDQMKINHKVASVCGRIHPIGSGPIVWFQQFEYWMRHCLQKAAGYLFGCVLCSAGCFSLFRASALLDDRVMRRYCQMAEEPRQMVQCDQGEDRWLCTLLLQQGHRITYCASADAQTYAPETSYEMYNQRRRWMPSTMANVIDLLSSFRCANCVDDNVTFSFMLYQVAQFSLYLLGPVIVTLTVSASWYAVLGTSDPVNYALATVPVLIFIVICFAADQSVQVFVGQVVNVSFSAVLWVAFVLWASATVADCLGSPRPLVLLAIVGCFALVAVLQWRGSYRGMPAVTFVFAFLPTYQMLILYSLCNLNVVSWGTRELPQATTNERSQTSESQTARGSIGKASSWQLRELFQKVFRQKKNAVSSTNMDLDVNDNIKHVCSSDWDAIESSKLLTSDALCRGPVEILSEDELAFWHQLIRRLLHPIPKDEEKEKKFETELKSLRTNLSLGYVLVNTLSLVIIHYVPLAVAFIYDCLFQSNLEAVMR